MIQYHELKRATTTAKTKVAKMRVEPKTFAISNLKHSSRLGGRWQLIDKLSVLWQSHLKKLLVFRIRLHFANMRPDPGYRSRLRQDSAFPFRTWIRTWNQKFGKNRTRILCHFSISAVAGFCAAIR